jgi:hypothetical protein
VLCNLAVCTLASSFIITKSLLCTQVLCLLPAAAACKSSALHGAMRHVAVRVLVAMAYAWWPRNSTDMILTGIVGEHLQTLRDQVLLLPGTLPAVFGPSWIDR